MRPRKLGLWGPACLIGLIFSTSKCVALRPVAGEISSFHSGSTQVPGGFGPFTAPVDWSPPFSDTNYFATCSIEAQPGFVKGRVEMQAGSRTPNNMIVGVSQLEGTSGTVLCIGVSPVRVVTFESTLADIENSLQLGLIDNDAIASSLSRKIWAAQDATGQARNNILNAFKNEVLAQSGNHVTGAAVQMLLDDADSLLKQFP